MNTKISMYIPDRMIDEAKIGGINLRGLFLAALEEALEEVERMKNRAKNASIQTFELPILTDQDDEVTVFLKGRRIRDEETLQLYVDQRKRMFLYNSSLRQLIQCAPDRKLATIDGLRAFGLDISR